MRRVFAYLGQAALYAGFAAFVGFFSLYPEYEHFDPAKALIKLSVTHTSQRAAECRKRTAEELAALAPNMRRPNKCERGRLPILVELTVNGEVVMSKAAAATGLYGDGPATVYERFPVDAGSYAVEAKLRDSSRGEGFDYVRTAHVDLEAGRILLIDFQKEEGGFIIR